MEKVELNLKTESQVALNLFHNYTGNLSAEKKTALYNDQKELLKTFANFVYAVKHCDKVQDIKR
jgi:hypothetical protein